MAHHHEHHNPSYCHHHAGNNIKVAFFLNFGFRFSIIEIVGGLFTNCIPPTLAMHSSMSLEKSP